MEITQAEQEKCEEAIRKCLEKYAKCHDCLWRFTKELIKAGIIKSA